MCYSIALRVFQTNPARGFFRIIEKTVWHYANGGTWSESDGVPTLTMCGSGTSGVLRFLSDKGEYFTIAVGVHNYKRWCDLIGNIKPNETAVLINGQYYNNGGRDYQREKQLAEYGGTSAVGTKVEIKFTVADGDNLAANIIIG